MAPRSVFLLAVTLFGAVVVAHDRPVIGILSQPYTGEANTHYIAASYVKYLESAGARVVPIPFNSNSTYLATLFKGLNGVLLPGGGTPLSADQPFYKTARFFHDAAIAAHANGDYFPIWGTCLGFELMAIMAADDHSILVTGLDSQNLPIPLELTPLAATSRMLGKDAPQHLVHAMATQDITMNNHQAGVTPDTWSKNAKLSAMFNVLSNNVDRKGRPFVSTIEGKTLPFYGTQWHPEKNPFEWTTKEQLPHSAIAVEAAQYLANFFVNEARKSSHVFNEAELEKIIIYNYTPRFTGKGGASAFTQSYVFPN